MEKKPTTVDDYIEGFPVAVRERLQELRSVLKEIAPEAMEKLKWGKPVFESSTILFAYSAHKNHLSFVPTGPAMKPFEKELGDFETKKDSVQFFYDQPLPKALVRKIAAYRKEDVESRGAKWKY